MWHIYLCTYPVYSYQVHGIYVQFLGIFISCTYMAEICEVNVAVGCVFFYIYAKVSHLHGHIA